MYDEINLDFQIQNTEISKMFTKQEECVKDIEPCLVTLERIHKQNSNLLEPIEHLTDEVSNTNMCNINIYFILFCMFYMISFFIF